ncbi:uncharacterized protein LOC135495078 [Lineus longissimus]|uniref:uncharacterized protein LOC135495078 n=1 Tax=Lineus longissimus TaxID=88925 RepID=UPI00315CF6FE
MEVYVPKKEEKLVGEGLVDLESLPTLSAYPGKSINTIERRDILDFGDEGFLLDNALSQEECKYYIDKAERMGLGPIHEANHSYRNSDRIMVRSPGLSEALFNRIKPYLTDIKICGDPKKKHITGIGFLLQGTWSPVGLNDAFRICRYYPGGHFAPHFDGHFVKDSNERSMVTLMLYLNGGFEGGPTNFVNEKQPLFKDEQGRYVAEEKNILYRVQPEAGLAIIFNHHRLHEGGALLKGVKYILRTDIMYRRNEAMVLTPKDEQGLQLMQEAERLEGARDEQKAAELYRKAFKLSPMLEDYYNTGST